MFSKISERHLHKIRWILTVGWLILIASLFYDPISVRLTATNAFFGSTAAKTCFEFQGECYPQEAYPMGARIFWGMIVPSSILILLIFGHEAWRRICPLSFLSQIPRALKWQAKRTISENSWLGRNHLYFQFSLLFIGLNIRLLLVNSDRFLLGIFLILTILSAITVGFLYGGKTWCNYFCPMAPVQMIYSEPSGLLGSIAHTAKPQTITQSMCRTIDFEGREKSACVGCKSNCMDIDAEHSYWENIKGGDRRLIYYAYVGLAIAFYVYFGLYSGNWHFLSGAVWQETNQLDTLFAPGFYLNDKAIAIPKIIAVPLTLTVFSTFTYFLGLRLEKSYRHYRKRQRQSFSLEQLRHHTFSLATFIAFNSIFFLGIYPTLGWFPEIIRNLTSWMAIALSSLWLAKAWNRNAEKYTRERNGHLLRRQLRKLTIDCSDYLDGRSLEDLNADELNALAIVMPNLIGQYGIKIYEGMLEDALEQKSTNIISSLREFQSLRKQLNISDTEHYGILEQLQEHKPQLFIHSKFVVVGHDDLTVIRPVKPQNQSDETIVRPNRSKP
ncbi:MAG: hypothetical protein AAF652_05050 [Cyanobacteria bacterium P01_C01_bin.72]